MKGRIYGFIPDKLVLWVWNILSVSVSPKNRDKHLAYNKELWKKQAASAKVGSYIERQDALGDMKLGNRPASYNSCEVIAVCNLMTAFSGEKDKDVKGLSFPECLEYFERLGLSGGGRLGVSYKRMLTFLSELGIGCISYSYEDYKNGKLPGGQRAYVVTVYNDKKNIFKMIHTVCITKEKAGYAIHNDAKNSGRRFATVNAAIDAVSSPSSRPIGIICSFKKKP